MTHKKRWLPPEFPFLVMCLLLFLFCHPLAEKEKTCSPRSPEHSFVCHESRMLVTNGRICIFFYTLWLMNFTLINSTEDVSPDFSCKELENFKAYSCTPNTLTIQTKFQPHCTLQQCCYKCHEHNNTSREQTLPCLLYSSCMKQDTQFCTNFSQGTWILVPLVCFKVHFSKTIYLWF